MIKKKWIENCSQPGARGQSALKEFEKIWKILCFVKFIPIVGWFTYAVYTKFFIPSIEEMEEALKERGII